jgi:TRAP-type C4-dicarboxylate transport system permease small subunit
MAWSGFVVLGLHFFAYGAGWAHRLNSWLKWLALVMGVIQGASLAFAVTSSRLPPELAERMPILALATVANFAAFMLVSSDERNRKAGA